MKNDNMISIIGEMIISATTTKPVCMERAANSGIIGLTAKNASAAIALSDVLYFLRSHILESNIKLAVYRIKGRTRNTYAAWIRQSLKTRSKVYFISVDVSALNNYVVQINPYT